RAVVVLAVLRKALKTVKKRVGDERIVITGAGASGIATAKLLMKEGARHIIGCDRAGAIYAGRTENMNPMKDWFAKHTNPPRVRGGASDGLAEARLVARPTRVGVDLLQGMNSAKHGSVRFPWAYPRSD